MQQVIYYTYRKVFVTCLKVKCHYKLVYHQYSIISSNTICTLLAFFKQIDFIIFDDVYNVLKLLFLWTHFWLIFHEFYFEILFSGLNVITGRAKNEKYESICITCIY